MSGEVTMKDVVAVNMATLKVRIIDRNKTAKNADAIVAMAVMRQGLDEEFFADVGAGKYHDGDKWEG